MSLALGIDKPSFIVNSEDRLSGTSEKFTYKLDIATSDHDYNQCAIVNVSIPKTYYCLREDTVLVVTELGTPHNVTVPKGNYNIYSFQTVLVGLLNAATPNSYVYSMSYPDRLIEVDTCKFTYTVTGNSGNDVKFEIENDNRLHHMMGLVFGDTYTFNSTLESARPVNFQHTRYVIIKSDLGSNTGNTDGHTEIFAKIPVNNVVDGGSISYNLLNLEDETKRCFNVKKNVFSFALYDDHGELLQLNGNEWFMTLFLYKHNFHDELHINHLKLENLEKL